MPRPITPEAVQSRASTERRRALAGAIGWSYDLLFPDDQRGLWALSSFTGGATLDAVEHVLRALGVPATQVNFEEAFAAWAFVRLIGTVPITPGDVGIVEFGLTTALIAFGGNNAGVVAAVLVFRFLTMVPTRLLGLLTAATWRRHRSGVGPDAGEPVAAETLQVIDGKEPD